jgi:hypothetical protein
MYVAEFTKVCGATLVSVRSQGLADSAVKHKPVPLVRRNVSFTAFAKLSFVYM